MKKIFYFLVMLTIYGCNKPKTVLICGDHVCINKAEAEQYFEDNLTLEVKVIDKKSSKAINLVELNLKSNSEGKKEISVLNKEKTDKEIKVLSNTDIKKTKEKLKKRKIAKQAKLKKVKINNKPKKNILKKKKIVNKPNKQIADICTILEKCSIDEISEYLVKQGEKKKFPDITIRENK